MALRNPVGVDVGEGLASLKTLLGLEGTDENSVGRKQVADSGTLGEELGVAENVEPDTRSRVGVEDGSHRFRSSAGDGRLLDDDLGRGSDSSDLSGSEFNVARDGEERSARSAHDRAHESTKEGD